MAGDWGDSDQSSDDDFFLYQQVENTHVDLTLTKARLSFIMHFQSLHASQIKTVLFQPCVPCVCTSGFRVFQLCAKQDENMHPDDWAAPPKTMVLPHDTPTLTFYQKLTIILL